LCVLPIFENLYHQFPKADQSRQGEGCAAGRSHNHDTAYGDAETKRTALESGAEGLLTKPIDFGTLRSEIDIRVARAA